VEGKVMKEKKVDYKCPGCHTTFKLMPSKCPACGKPCMEARNLQP
jgi:rRNA maturation endonuclease Nob1